MYFEAFKLVKRVSNGHSWGLVEFHIINIMLQNAHWGFSLIAGPIFVCFPHNIV